MLWLLTVLATLLSALVVVPWFIFTRTNRPHPSLPHPAALKTRHLPPQLTSSATRIAQRIAAGQWTSEDVVRKHIAQQKRVNPLLNAVVDTRYEQALQEARACDARLAELRQKRRQAEVDQLFHEQPLFGVPCSVKECFAVKGMSQTAGLVSRLGTAAEVDATAVQRLKAAGAIVLGVTNTSELCMWMESANRCFGRTNNPYNVRHTVGGSSGGEGCIVSACGAPVGLGSDIGGSIRMPAFFNGVFGHKPTGGLVPGTGQYPISDPGDALRYLTTGPIVRHAEDLILMLRIMHGPDGEDSECTHMGLQDPETVDLRKVTVLNIAHPRVAIGRPSADLCKAQQAAFDYLKTVCTPASRDISVEKLQHALDIWSNMLQSAQVTSFSQLLGTGGDFRELLRWVVRRSSHTLPAIGLALLERVTKRMPARQRRFVELGLKLKEELIDILQSLETGHEAGRHSVILFPSYSQTAPRHHQPLFPPINYTYTCIWNVMETPVTQVPLGLSSETGLPTGVQVIGLHGHDHVTIRIALELERKFGGWAHRE